MKIAVIGSNGRVGSLIVKEALKRGLNVTAIARRENKSEAAHYINKDLFDLTTKDLESFDVVVDAFGVFDPTKAYLHMTSLEHLCDIMSHQKKRLIVVGGAGSLYMDKTHTTQLIDTSNFPEQYKPVASNMSKALTELRKRSDVEWTYISPAADFVFDGKVTGKYVLRGEEFATNAEGKSEISYGDYAIGFVDEIVSGKHIQQRISLTSE